MQVLFLDPKVSASKEPFKTMTDDIAHLADVAGIGAAVSALGLNAKSPPAAATVVESVDKKLSQ